MELNKWDYKQDYENGDKIAIKLFASGSFLNPEEVPKEARDYVLNKLANMETLLHSLPDLQMSFLI